MSIKTKLGSSSTLAKLLNADHKSVVNSIKHEANVEIQKTAKHHHDNEAQNLIMINNACKVNADKVYAESANECNSFYKAAVNDDKTSLDQATRDYNNCLGQAETAYNTAVSDCDTEFANEYSILSGVIDGVMNNTLNTL